MSLPQGLPLGLMQNTWATSIDPLLKNPLSNGNFLKSVVLASGNNVINHLLSRMPQGWFITDINATADIYRSQPFNAKTLTLNSSAVATVNIYVF